MMSGGSTFSALRYQQFRLLWGGLVAGNLGFWMQQFAFGWLVVQLAVAEGRPELGGLYLGLRAMASTLPAVAFGLVAGVIADRMDRRSLLIRTRIASAAVSIAIAALVITGQVGLLAAALLSAVASAMYAFDPPARHATVPRLVPRQHLFSAMGLARFAMQSSRTIGPLIAGILVIPAGVGGVFLAKAGLDIAAVGALVPMRPQPPEPGAGSVGMLGSFRQSLAYIGRDDLTRWLLTLELSFSVFGMAFVQLLPALAVDTLRVGAVELSWLMAGPGVGAVAGAFLIANSGRIRRRGLALLVTLGAVGLMNAALGLQRELVGALLVLLVLGVLQQLYMGMQSVILQLATPDALRGRVMSVQSVIIHGVGPLGVLAVGSLGVVVGVSSAIALAGIVVLGIAAFAAARIRAIGDLRAEPPDSQRSVDPFARPAVAEAAE